MPLKYEVPPTGQMILVTATGIVTRDDFDQLRARILSDERIAGPTNLLMETGKADAHLTFTDLQEISARLQGLFDKGIVRVAIVAKSNFIYSLAKTFGVFAAREPVRIKPFRKTADAIEWLNSPS
jgi:SpoIIAA-like